MSAPIEVDAAMLKQYKKAKAQLIEAQKKLDNVNKKLAEARGKLPQKVMDALEVLDSVKEIGGTSQNAGKVTVTKDEEYAIQKLLYKNLTKTGIKKIELIEKLGSDYEWAKVRQVIKDNSDKYKIEGEKAGTTYAKA